MTTGIDRLLQGEPATLAARLRTSRLGLLTNDLALTADLRRSREALVSAGWRLARLFAPEHGMSGRAKEGELVDDAVDPVTGSIVRSLYGASVSPDLSDLADLEAVLVDLPDVGSRFYTYIWTISHLLETCALAGVAVVVLDRPNPIGGLLDRAEGPILDERCHSLVGRWPIPVRHSLTVGELCRHWVRTREIPVELHVVETPGWNRATTAIGSCEPTWMPPSPNIPTPATALLYPGTCFVEGVNLAEGRGTAVPFRVLAAPFLNGEELARRIRAAKIPGLAAVPYGFTPLVRDHAGEPCDGVILHITDIDALRPVSAGVRLLSIVAHMHPDELQERHGIAMPGESERTSLERLFGRLDALNAIATGEWDDATRFSVPDWAELVAPDLLYQ
ncbi:exo-beta-N-acetylmuramidase NamZ domain-containing protein [Streptomyces niveus]|uniref:exo-beta-N-acetylmuramidase NamZ family protein n=1 Tax=Streptomyces niveus TaxID=193462 RepID=UPI003723F177